MLKRFLSILLVLASWAPCLALAEGTAIPSATIQEAIETFLQGEMARGAQDATDPWQRFIYEQGVAEISEPPKNFDLSKEKPLTVKFKLASAQPRILEQPKYSGDPEAWLQGVAKTMRELNYSGQVTLSITVQDGGYVAAFAPRTQHVLPNLVRSLAAKAKNSYSASTLQTAVVDYFMPTPITISFGNVPKALNPEEYKPAYVSYLTRNGLDEAAKLYLPALLYGIKGYQLDVSGGPEAFRLTYTLPDLNDLIMDSGQTLCESLNYDENAKKYTAEEKKQLLKAQINKDIISYRRNEAPSAKGGITFSLLDLPKTIDPESFYTNASEPMQSSVSNALTEVDAALQKMPDYPALATLPKNGLISGPSSGTKFTFKTNADGLSRVVQVFDANTDEMERLIFLESGMYCTVRIPQGDHYFVIGMGKLWYGEDKLFGEAGSYSKTPTFTILGKEYTYTVTLNPKKHGNTEIEQIDYSMVAAGESSSILP